jgi:hypothetical protein
VLGLSITNRLARLWPGGPAAADLHEHASLLGLAFGLLHALVLLGDAYIGYTLPQLLIPFASVSLYAWYEDGASPPSLRAAGCPAIVRLVTEVSARRQLSHPKG